MARPTKNYCDYFPHDRDMRNHRKIRALRNKFGIVGYAIWNLLLEYLTGIDGNEFENSDIEFELMSGDFGVSVTEISDVVNYCLRLELLFDKNGFIHSPSLDENLIPVYEKRKQAKKLSAKQLRNNGKYVTNNAASNGVSVTEMPQSKLDNSKEEEIKLPAVTESKSFIAFKGWLKDHAENVGKMKEPFTEQQFESLITDFEGTDIKELLLAMHNHKDLLKKNVSANLTFRNWAKRRNLIPKGELIQQPYKAPNPYL